MVGTSHHLAVAQSHANPGVVCSSIAGFNQAGRMMVCHAGEAGKDFGHKYTSSPGEKGDIWHWKSVRTGPVGQADDQYVDDARWSETVP